MRINNLDVFIFSFFLLSLVKMILNFILTTDCVTLLMSVVTKILYTQVPPQVKLIKPPLMSNFPSIGILQ